MGSSPADRLEKRRGINGGGEVGREENTYNNKDKDMVLLTGPVGSSGVGVHLNPTINLQSTRKDDRSPKPREHTRFSEDGWRHKVTTPDPCYIMYLKHNFCTIEIIATKAKSARYSRL